MRALIPKRDLQKLDRSFGIKKPHTPDNRRRPPGQRGLFDFGETEKD